MLWKWMGGKFDGNLPGNFRFIKTKLSWKPGFKEESLQESSKLHFTTSNDCMNLKFLLYLLYVSNPPIKFIIFFAKYCEKHEKWRIWFPFIVSSPHFHNKGCNFSFKHFPSHFSQLDRALIHSFQQMNRTHEIEFEWKFIFGGNFLFFLGKHQVLI